MNKPTLFQRHTLAQVSDRYDRERAPFLAHATAAEYRRCWRAEILRGLGAEQRVATLCREQILTWHVGMGSHPFAANRALNLLAHGLTLAESWGWRSGPNPCAHLQRFPEPPRQRRFGLEEVHVIGETLRDLRFDQHITPESDDAIRVLLLTGARKTEILALAWRPGVPESSGWCDLATGILHLTSHKTKRQAGTKEIVLSVEAIELFRRRRATASSPWVFPGRRGNHLKGLQRAWERVRTAAEVPDSRVHDLRRTYASILGDLGVPLSDIGDQLGQRDLATTRKHYSFAGPVHKRAVAEIAARKLAPALGR